MARTHCHTQGWDGASQQNPWFILEQSGTEFPILSGDCQQHASLVGGQLEWWPMMTPLVEIFSLHLLSSGRGAPFWCKSHPHLESRLGGSSGQRKCWNQTYAWILKQLFSCFFYGLLEYLLSNFLQEYHLVANPFLSGTWDFWPSIRFLRSCVSSLYQNQTLR